jgi:hypothetical protein
MIFGGCYAGATDAGDSSVEDRFGKSCYYSYDEDRSASYTSNSDDKGSDTKTDGGFTLTMKADAVAGNAEQMVQVLTQMRYEAGLVASHHIAQSCWEADDIEDSCKQTCDEQGMEWNSEVVVCEDCVVQADGSLKCGNASPFLMEALQQPWHGEKAWSFTDPQNQLQLVMYPPKLEENENGELVWVSNVEVSGFCFCACTGG